MKITLALIALSLTSSLAHAEDLSAPFVNDRLRARNLVNAVHENCNIHQAMNGYTLSNFERYVIQVVYPDLKMLSTAFRTAFSAFRSANLKDSYCVITFLGLPNNSVWEKNHDNYQKAVDAGTLPAQMFAGFDDADNVVLKRLEKTN